MDITGSKERTQSPPFGHLWARLSGLSEALILASLQLEYER